MGKINYGRMILGGVVGTVVLFIVGFLFQGVILGSHHEFFIRKGMVLAQPREFGWIAHISGSLTCGLVLSICYVVARKFRGPGPMTATISGFIIGLFTAGDATAEFAFYNLGSMIPLMSFANNVVGAILASLVAGAIYKE
ncbi:MAG: hypothetical protein QM737_18965 [Ferruginibacter sp.]